MQVFDWTPEGDKRRMEMALRESPEEFTCSARQAHQAYQSEVAEVAIRAQELFAEVGQPLDTFEATALAIEALEATTPSARKRVCLY